ncbi:Tad domain-containing protein [Sphingomonas sp. SM33]|jgi:Flp pilus assembly protein TadG|uniref:Tad domain-containing protein n=1 Tax=Sphingomonas telluris TaxID=2907998 RepID=A0ABS9VJ50_9SPHN|nr:Tad domain-containing protein [Sphingomonas telluris]MCH8614997.1 Tad domain-containing protein [Sphingomonas telluris]
MISFLKRLARDRKGNALLVMAAALPLVMGSAGLASDTIQWVLWKRQLQRAADSAAFAGVYAKFQGQDIPSAVSTDLSKNNQTQIALVSGYPGITYPANTSSYNNAVRVVLAVQKRLSFSSLFLSSPPMITAEATAAAIQTGDYCVVSLENTSTTGISVGGNSNVDLGCGMITNSTSLDAAVAFGSSYVDASPIAAVGGLDATDNWAAGTQLLPFTLAQQDPFKDVYPPSAPSTCSNDPNVSPSQTLTDMTGSTSSTNDDALQPGCYRGFTIKGTVKLQPGVYYIDGGDFNVNSGAYVEGTDVTFVLTNSNAASTSIGNVDINGGATMKLKAPDSGTYSGILFYQDRRATDSQTSKINGNSSSFFQGAMYFPSQPVIFNGTAGINTNCMQLVARRVTFTGNSAINNTCPANSGSGSFKGRHIRLVA